MVTPRPYILVVDDNRITTKLMMRYLEANGIEADEASDGIDCLEKVALRIPDAIILDVMMPRLDGFETVKALKANPSTASIPVAIVTALNDSATQSKAVESGADDFLTKPIEEKLLIRKAIALSSSGTLSKRIASLEAIVDAFSAGNKELADELMRKHG